MQIRIGLLYNFYELCDSLVFIMVTSLGGGGGGAGVIEIWWGGETFCRAPGLVHKKISPNSGGGGGGGGGTQVGWVGGRASL